MCRSQPLDDRKKEKPSSSAFKSRLLACLSARASYSTLLLRLLPARASVFFPPSFRRCSSSFCLRFPRPHHEAFRAAPSALAGCCSGAGEPARWEEQLGSAAAAEPENSLRGAGAPAWDPRHRGLPGEETAQRRAAGLGRQVGGAQGNGEVAPL